jgi:hypothetical protein
MAAFLMEGNQIRNHKNRFIIFIVALIFFVFGLRFVQVDIMTTGLWFDKLGLQLVLSTKEYGGISMEGWMVGISISAFQIYLSYKALLANKPRDRNLFLAAWAFAAIFDTMTDVDYRSYSFSTPILTVKTILVSIFLYTFFSEWALSTGFREMVTNFDSTFLVIKEVGSNLSGAMAAIRGGGRPVQFKNDQPRYQGGFFDNLGKGNKNKGKGGGGNNNRPPQPQQAKSYERPSQRYDPTKGNPASAFAQARGLPPIQKPGTVHYMPAGPEDENEG